MATVSFDDLITQGYMITDANNKYAAEAWVLPAALFAEFNTVFHEFRTIQAQVLDLRISKEALVKKAAEEQNVLIETIYTMKKFIRVVADKELSNIMFHRLGVDILLPKVSNELITLVRSVTIPHLNDWDGTPQQIDAQVKNDIITQLSIYSDAVRDSNEIQAISTTATQTRDFKRKEYIEVLAKIRNWLYIKLPHKKYDQHLSEYGFEVWNKPIQHKLLPPTGFVYDNKAARFKWIAADNAKEYRIEMKKSSEENYTIVAETKNTYWIMKDPYFGTHDFRVRSISGNDESDATASIRVTLEAYMSIKNFRYDASEMMLRWDELPIPMFYLVLANDDEFGDPITVNYMYVRPDSEMDLRMQVWATNGTYATPRSEVVIIPRA